MFKNYPDVITVEDLMEMLHIGKSSAYKLLHNNQIRHVRSGKKYIIPKQSVIAFLTSFCYNNEEIINGRLQQSLKEA